MDTERILIYGEISLELTFEKIGKKFRHFEHLKGESYS